MRDCEVRYKVFTDQVSEVEKIGQWMPVDVLETEHREWPYVTLYRFHTFGTHLEELKGDYQFYVDVDTLFVDKVEGILGERVAVQHCGFVNRRGPFERNPKSKAFAEGHKYYGGGFWGFSRVEFEKMVGEMIEAIDADGFNGVMAKWHDESHLNRYLVEHPPTLVLSPSFHYPEKCPGHQHIRSVWRQEGVDFEPKLVLLWKNHANVR